MAVFAEHHIDRVNHYTPLHYLPFIARSRSLLCKPSLAALGFGNSHLRSKSRAHDTARGFGEYAFLTLEQNPRIVRAKLAAGFPHIGISVPAEAIDCTTYSLCRFNVAMTRYLRRHDSLGFPESATNGRYYGDQQIPVARTVADKRAMLKKHYPKTMIEVLIHGDLPLPDTTNVICYSPIDAGIAASVLRHLNAPWEITLSTPPGDYPRRADHGDAVQQFIESALDDPAWRGNGLEFDRV